MSGYFIAATGTGVGKTFTTCALLHALPEARGYKPVISGWDAEDTQSDTRQIIEVSGGGEIEVVSPWCFGAPLSPHRAAVLEGKKIALDALVAWTDEQAKQPGLTLIETVGGVMVPLTDTHTTLDWMAAVNLPVILVAGSYLGTISHTLTALHALRARGLEVAALVLNESEGSSVTLTETEAGLSSFIADIPLRIVQPRVSSWKEAREIQALAGRL